MAERNQTRGRNGSRSDNGSDRQTSGGSRSRSRSRLSARDAVARVREELPALLGRPIEAVLGVQRDEEDGWEVTVSVVELARIPNTTDVLGSYAVMLDDSGELVAYQRRRRYNRGQPDED